MKKTVIVLLSAFMLVLYGCSSQPINNKEGTSGLTGVSSEAGFEGSTTTAISTENNAETTTEISETLTVSDADGNELTEEVKTSYNDKQGTAENKGEESTSQINDTSQSEESTVLPEDFEMPAVPLP